MKKKIFIMILVVSSKICYAGDVEMLDYDVEKALFKAEKRLEEFDSRHDRPLWMQKMFLSNALNRLTEAIEEQEGSDSMDEELEDRTFEAIERIEYNLEILSFARSGGQV